MRKKIRAAVILVAGTGNRISELPLTRILPKPMLPLLNKPIVEYIISKLKEVGVEQVYFVVNFKKEVFKEYFGKGQEFGVNINYIDCPDPNNIGKLADGVYLAKKFINQPFFVILGDDFTPLSTLKVFTDFFENKNAMAVTAVIKENDLKTLSLTCSVKLDDNQRIVDMEEKPTRPKWMMRGCGIYIFDPKVFRFIEETPVIGKGRDITKTLEIMAKKTKRVFGLTIDENININTLNDLYRATMILLSFRKFKK